MVSEKNVTKFIDALRKNKDITNYNPRSIEENKNQTKQSKITSF